MYFASCVSQVARHSVCATVHFMSLLANGTNNGNKTAHVYRSSSGGVALSFLLSFGTVYSKKSMKTI